MYVQYFWAITHIWCQSCIVHRFLTVSHDHIPEIMTYGCPKERWVSQLNKKAVFMWKVALCVRGGGVGGGNSTQLQLETLPHETKCHRCVFSLKTITTQSSKGNRCRSAPRAELGSASLFFPPSLLPASRRLRGSFPMWECLSTTKKEKVVWRPGSNSGNSFIMREGLALSCVHKERQSFIVNESKKAEQRLRTQWSFPPRQVWAWAVTTLGEVACNRRAFWHGDIRNKSLLRSLGEYESA